MDIFEKLEGMGLGNIETSDTEREIKPINGKYVCSLIDAGNLKGTSERTGNDYDFWVIKGVVTKDVRGDKGVNRRADRLVSFNDTDWSTAFEELGKYIGYLNAILCRNEELSAKLVEIGNTIFTLKTDNPEITIDELMSDIREPLNELANEAIGTTFLGKISPRKNKNKELKRDSNGWPEQNLLPVKEFREKGKVIDVAMTAEEEVPF